MDRFLAHDLDVFLIEALAVICRIIDLPDLSEQIGDIFESDEGGGRFLDTCLLKEYGTECRDPSVGHLIGGAEEIIELKVNLGSSVRQSFLFFCRIDLVLYLQLMDRIGVVGIELVAAGILFAVIDILQPVIEGIDPGAGMILKSRCDLRKVSGILLSGKLLIHITEIKEHEHRESRGFFESSEKYQLIDIIELNCDPFPESRYIIVHRFGIVHILKIDHMGLEINDSFGFFSDKVDDLIERTAQLLGESCFILVSVVFLFTLSFGKVVRLVGKSIHPAPVDSVIKSDLVIEGFFYSGDRLSEFEHIVTARTEPEEQFGQMIVEIVSVGLEIDIAELLPEGIVIVEKLVCLSGIETSFSQHTHGDGKIRGNGLSGFGLIKLCKSRIIIRKPGI